MKFYPKALLVTVLAAVVLWFAALNVRAGIAAAIALGALCEFELLWPTGLFRRTIGLPKRNPN
jgi:hypothetical protein